ncbi:MAG: hypothetical protein JSR77_04440 [Planctomycetes bacterium]|nr:hypothetical protein [Planctomycetota bacterium]
MEHVTDAANGLEGQDGLDGGVGDEAGTSHAPPSRRSRRAAVVIRWLDSAWTAAIWTLAVVLLIQIIVDATRGAAAKPKPPLAAAPLSDAAPASAGAALQGGGDGAGKPGR